MSERFTRSFGRVRTSLLSGYLMVLAVLLLTLLAPGAFAQHVANPYAGATGFVDPYFAQQVAAEAANQSGPTQQQMYTVENQSTAVWLTSIASIQSLPQFIDAALSEEPGAPPVPIVMTIVIYDLPQRDCSSLGASGELSIAGGDTVQTSQAPGGGTETLTGSGIDEYESDFIDPIYNILAQYATNPNIRFVLIIEPDSIPNLITNAGHVTAGWTLAVTDGVTTTPGTVKATNLGTLVAPNCVAANGGAANGGVAEPPSSTLNPNSVYVQGITYALNKFHPLTNVYQYLDVGTSAWLGWGTNMNAAVTYYTALLKGTNAGLSSIDGFISNTSNFDPVKEPYLDPLLAPVNGIATSGNSSTYLNALYYSYNQSIDEEDYDEALYTKLTAPGGFPNTIGFLIDTGRNGWGGPLEPTGLNTNSNPETEILNSKIDLRPFRGDWCNVANAGIGPLPAANPLSTFPQLEAYVWVKPPGESDGTYPTSQSQVGPGYDPNCNPTNILENGAYQNNMVPPATTGSAPNSLLGGDFWPSYFDTLVANANINPNMSAGSAVTPLPETPPGLTLYAQSNALTVPQGGTVTDEIFTTVGGYKGNVNFDVINYTDSDISLSIPSVTAPNPGTLTVAPSSTVIPGNYLIEVSSFINGQVWASNVYIFLTVTAAPGFTMSPAEAILNVTPPAAGNTTLTDAITVAPTGGFTGNVTLGYGSVPPGVTASFSPNPASISGAASATSTLTLSVGTTAVPGTYTIPISGISAAAGANTNVTLAIGQAPARLKMILSATALSATQGNSITDTVTVTNGGSSSGGVTLAASGVPSGVSVAYSTQQPAATNVITFTVTPAAIAGTYPVTITATAPGVPAASTVISLTVAPAPFSCHVAYTIETQWPGGFEAGITINNTSVKAISNWTLTWTFANGQKITQLWDGNVTQSGANVSVTNMSYNGSIAAGGSFTGVGFNGTWNNKTNAVPMSFAINGTACK